MKKSEKKMLIILIIVSIIIIGLIFLVTRQGKNEKAEQNDLPVEEFVDVLEDGTKLNNSTKLNQTKIYNGLKFTNVQLTEKDSKTELIADVINESGNDVDVMLFNIILYDKNGNEIVKLGGITSPMKAGEKTQFSTSSTLDYANAYDFKIVE